MEALDTGADDYLTKPFAFVVLVARLRALMRRGRRERPAVLSPATCGSTRPRAGSGAARRARADPREFALLEFLLRHRGEVSKPEILDHVWDYGLRGRPEHRRGLRPPPARQAGPAVRAPRDPDGPRRRLPVGRRRRLTAAGPGVRPAAVAAGLRLDPCGPPSPRCSWWPSCCRRRLRPRRAPASALTRRPRRGRVRAEDVAADLGPSDPCGAGRAFPATRRRAGPRAGREVVAGAPDVAGGEAPVPTVPRRVRPTSRVPSTTTRSWWCPCDRGRRRHGAGGPRWTAATSGVGRAARRRPARPAGLVGATTWLVVGRAWRRWRRSGPRWTRSRRRRCTGGSRSRAAPTRSAGWRRP